MSFDPYQMAEPKKIFRVEASYALFYSIPPPTITASRTFSDVHRRIVA